MVHGFASGGGLALYFTGFYCSGRYSLRGAGPFACSPCHIDALLLATLTSSRRTMPITTQVGPAICRLYWDENAHCVVICASYCSTYPITILLATDTRATAKMRLLWTHATTNCSPSLKDSVPRCKGNTVTPVQRTDEQLHCLKGPHEANVSWFSQWQQTTHHRPVHIST